MSKILLVGIDHIAHLGRYFHAAATQLGHTVCFVDEHRTGGSTAIARSTLGRFVYRALGRRPAGYWSFNRTLLRAALEFRPSVVLVLKGAFVKPATLEAIRAKTGAMLVNYSTDDPFNPVNSSPDLRNGIPVYDVYASVRRSALADLERAGCRRAVYIRVAYDPTIHYPERPMNEAERERFASEVVFVGAYDSDRKALLEPLAKMRGMQFRLYGGNYRWSPFRDNHRGFVFGREYRLALCGSKIGLGLVRRANRDGHSMRSFEIPACRVFMLAERTDEHLELFEEDKEAAYFSSTEELVDKVRYYLRNEEDRERIAQNGFARVTKGGHTYKDRIVEIMKYVQRSVQ